MRWFILIMLIFLPGCTQEPDFDERFEKADREIREKAAAIDAGLSETGKPAGDAPIAREESR